MPHRRLLSAMMLTAVLATTGCWTAAREKTVPPVHYQLQYPAAEYPAAVVEHREASDAVLRVERFAAPPPLRDRRMAYRSSSLTTDHYAYHRWVAAPPDLVSDYLARDLRQSGLFRAVFVFDDTTSPTHEVGGLVTDFHEQDDHGGWQAVAAVVITLSRAEEPDAARRILLHKHYLQRESCHSRQPAAVAEAMSRAMARLSTRVITDIHRAIQPEPPPG